MPDMTSLSLPRKRLGFWGFVVAVLLIGLSFGFASGWGTSLKKGWELVGVTALEPAFTDLNSTCLAGNFYAAGGDPYHDLSYDPLNRAINLTPAMLHLEDSLCGFFPDVGLHGWVLTLFSMALLASLAAPMSFSGGLLLGLTTCLGAGALAFERGNCDLLVLPFLLLAGSIPFGLERLRHSFWALGIFAALLLVSTSLKIYPAFALLGCLAFPDQKQRRYALLVGIVAISLWVFWERDLIRMLLAYTPSSPKNSYGIPAALLFFTFKPGFTLALRALWTLGIGAASWVVFKGMAKAKAPETSEPFSPRFYALCLMGSGIFLATYLLSASFNYRLIFGLLAFPYLWQQGKKGQWAAMGYGLFCIWPFIEFWAATFLPWVPIVKAAFFAARQLIGFGLASLALGWLAFEALHKLGLLRAAQRA
jgi:hypothetical protein